MDGDTKYVANENAEGAAMTDYEDGLVGVLFNQFLIGRNSPFLQALVGFAAGGMVEKVGLVGGGVEGINFGGGHALQDAGMSLSPNWVELNSYPNGSAYIVRGLGGTAQVATVNGGNGVTS